MPQWTEGRYQPLDHIAHTNLIVIQKHPKLGLVSAAIANGMPEWVEIVSEAVTSLRVEMPQVWSNGVWVIRQSGEQIVTGDMIQLSTTAGEVIRLLPVRN